MEREREQGWGNQTQLNNLKERKQGLAKCSQQVIALTANIAYRHP